VQAAMGVAPPPCLPRIFASCASLVLCCALALLLLSCALPCGALRATRAASFVKHSRANRDSMDFALPSHVRDRSELQGDRVTSELLALLEEQEEQQEQNVAMIDLEDRPESESEDDASLVETKSRERVASLDDDDEDTERPLASAHDLERAKGLKKMPKKKKVPIWMRKHRRRKIPATKSKDPYVHTPSHPVAEDDSDDEDDSYSEGDHGGGGGGGGGSLYGAQEDRANAEDGEADDALYQSELRDQQQQQASSAESADFTTEADGREEEGEEDSPPLQTESPEHEDEELDTSRADEEDIDSQTEWSDPESVVEEDPSS